MYNRAVHLLTWNIKGNRGLSTKSIATVASLIDATAADLITLQEVHRGTAAKLQAKLAGIGLTHAHYSGTDGARCKHGELIASRYPLKKPRSRWTAKVRYPELMGHVVLKHPDAEIDVITAHIPNGSGNGWVKVEALEALSSYLAKAPDRPRIVSGDFNEPRRVHPDGTFETFGHKRDRDGNMSAAGTKKGTCGETRPRSDWCDAVTNVLDGEAQHGLRHAYFDTHAFDPNPVTYRTPNLRFFDHILVSKHFEVDSIRYQTDWIDRGWSDHAPGLAHLFLR